MKTGIDISKHNGEINFKKLKNSGMVDFVILRSSYRQQEDPLFKSYVKGCKENGIMIFGVYHFLYALTAEAAKEEARYCVKTVESAGLEKGTYIFCDFEYDSVTKAAQKGVKLTPKECNQFTEEFCNEVKKSGYKVGIYANNDYYENWYDKAVLDKYPIWLADYKGVPDHKCIVQQYTSKGVIPGISGNVDLNKFLGEDLQNEGDRMYSRSEVVKQAESWLGLKESDGSYKVIIDTYNKFQNHPRGIKMEYDWAWCACTVSAIAIKLGYTEVMPIEISCGYLIEEAKKMRCWLEKDNHVPKPGDLVLYDWTDSGKGDNTGWPDHVGVVEWVDEKAGYFTVIEGNYSNSVKKRTVSINGRFIRGFITPKYNDDKTIVYDKVGTSKDINTVAREVIAGIWGDGKARKEALERNGIDYDSVQKKVNEILNGSAVRPLSPIQSQEQPVEKVVECTCYAKSRDADLRGIWMTVENLYLRNDAGKNKKALVVMPVGTKVHCYGNYTEFNGIKWALVDVVIDGVKYTGFCSGKYLKKV